MHLARLRRVRERRALSQAELARASGVSTWAIVHAERGETSVHGSTARKLAAALGVEPAALMAPDPDLAAAMPQLEAE